MREYALRRLFMMVPVIIGVTIIIFVLMRLIPGDVTTLMVGDRAQKEISDELRTMLGLDQPLYTQYFVWVSHVARGDFGRSYLTKRPVFTDIANAIPVSAELAIFAVVFATLFGIPLGIVSAIRKNTWVDYVCRIWAISGISIPTFWTATMFILITSLYFHWMPSPRYVSLWQDPVANLVQFIIPALFLGYRSMGVYARMTRSTLLEVLHQDYIRTAWAKGLRERVVIIRHALKNGIIPVVTIGGNELAFLLGGAVITETIFSLPGMGRLLIESIARRDYPIVQAIILFIAVIVVFANLAVDLSYAWFDPRIRYRKS